MRWAGPRLRRLKWRGAVLGVALACATAGELRAQAGRACTLRLQADSSLSVGEGRQPEAYVHYARDNVVTKCGDARITADSAVYFERLGRVEMIGDVHYRDTTRVLDAAKLTFFEREDRVLTQGSVVLTRLRSGSVLSGPRVEFFRTMKAGADRTLATSRPHMTLPTGPPGGRGEPFEIDADVVEIQGEDRAVARGDVEIERTDLSANSDSARFDMGAGEGWLFGSPIVESRKIRLSGDSVRARVEEGDLREIEAMGRSTAVGARFDLISERIRARVGEERVEALWAFGEGRAVAHSGRHTVAGDSVVFAFARGELDSLVAVGDARAVRTPSAGAEADSVRTPEPPIETGDEDGWLVGDTVVARFRPAGEAASDEEGEAELEILRAVGQARSYFASIDSTEAGGPTVNYLIGRSIEVRFRDGEASEIRGEDAIGVYRGAGEDGPAPGSRSNADGRPETTP
ncbi:MAG: LptA/OstA family protein [Gemmatimonadota bacterium]